MTINKKSVKLLEVELVIIIAVTILLGAIIGYSLAAASKTGIATGEPMRISTGSEY